MIVRGSGSEVSVSRSSATHVNRPREISKIVRIMSTLNRERHSQRDLRGYTRETIQRRKRRYQRETNHN